MYLGAAMHSLSRVEAREELRKSSICNETSLWRGLCGGVGGGSLYSGGECGGCCRGEGVWSEEMLSVIFCDLIPASAQMRVSP